MLNCSRISMMTSIESLSTWLVEKPVRMGMQRCRPLSSEQCFSCRTLSGAKTTSCINVVQNRMRKEVLRPSGGEDYGAWCESYLCSMYGVLSHLCSFAPGERIESVICVDPLPSKRIFSAGQSGRQDLVMGLCINFKIPAVLVTWIAQGRSQGLISSKMIRLESHDTFCNRQQQ